MKRILPHVCLDLSFIFLTLTVIDRFNPAMHFLSRDIFKIPLMIFLLLVITESVLLIASQRRELRRSLRETSRPAETNTNNEKHPVPELVITLTDDSARKSAGAEHKPGKNEGRGKL